MLLDVIEPAKGCRFDITDVRNVRKCMDGTVDLEPSNRLAKSPQ